jgi:vacuolar-type H+-ATPase subunit I/STV1
MAAKPPKRMSRQMALSELAALLEMDGPAGRRRLLGQLRRLEEARGVRILVETGKGNGKRYYATLATLREHHPDLFYRRDEVVEHMREYIEELDDRFDAVNDKIHAVAQMTGDKLRATNERVARLEAKL